MWTAPFTNEDAKGRLDASVEWNNGNHLSFIIVESPSSIYINKLNEQIYIQNVFFIFFKSEFKRHNLHVRMCGFLNILKLNVFKHFVVFVT